MNKARIKTYFKIVGRKKGKRYDITRPQKREQDKWKKEITHNKFEFERL